MSDSRGITINGQLFNGPDWIDGVEWEITEVTGMGEPAAVFSSEQNVGADGAWATTGFSAPRALGLSGVIRATDIVRAELAFDKLRHLLSLAEFPITWHYASGDRTLWARRDGEFAPESRDLPTDFTWKTVLKVLSPAFLAGDAAGSANIILTTGLPQSTGGITFPITFPITFTGSSSTGDVTATLGDAGGRATYRIDGPVTDPQIVVENSRGLYRLAWKGTIPAGMWLDIDPVARQARLQGQSGMVPYVRLWPELAPGVNTIRFRAAAYDTGTLTVTIQPHL